MKVKYSVWNPISARAEKKIFNFIFKYQPENHLNYYVY